MPQVIEKLPKALTHLHQDGVILLLPITRVELLIKATDTRNSGDDVTCGYSKSAVNGVNSKNVHGTGTVSYHTRDADAMKYLVAIKEDCRQWVCDIRLLQAQSDAEAQAYRKKECDDRVPSAKDRPELFKAMNTAMQDGIVRPFMDSINKCIEDNPGDFNGASTFTDLMPYFIGILSENRKANLLKSNGDGRHLITEIGIKLATYLVKDGFNAYDAASLEAYVTICWAFVVTVRGQSVWDNKSSTAYAEEMTHGWEVIQVRYDDYVRLLTGVISACSKCYIQC